MNRVPQGQRELKKLSTHDTHENVQGGGGRALESHDFLLDEFREIEFGNDPLGLETHDQFLGAMEALASHIDLQQPLLEEMPRVVEGLKTHRDNLQPLLAHDEVNEALNVHNEVNQALDVHNEVNQALDTHGVGKPGYELEKGSFLGLHIVAWKLMLTQALRNCENLPVAKQWFQALSLCFFRNTTGYSDEEYKDIMFAQSQMLKENMDDIIVLLRQPIHIPYTAAKIAELTGGMMVGVGSIPSGDLERQLRDRVRLDDQFWDKARGDTVDEKAEFFKQNYIGSVNDIGKGGTGFSGPFEQLRTIAFEDYEKKHPVVETQVQGEDGIVAMYLIKEDDNPGNKERIARELVVWRKNHQGEAKSANAFESYLKAKLPNDEYGALKKDIESVIREAITEEFVLDLYQPKYKPEQTFEEKLQAEFDAAIRFNIRKEDRRSASEVVNYLQVNREIGKDLQKNRVGVEVSETRTKTYNDFIKKQIEEGKLEGPPFYDQDSNIRRIVDEELINYEWKKPDAAADDYETTKAFKDYLTTKRDIYNKKGVREGDAESKKITEAELDDYLKTLVKWGVMRG